MGWGPGVRFQARDGHPERTDRVQLEIRFSTASTQSFSIVSVMTL